MIPLESATQSDVSGAFDRLGEHAVDGVIILIERHHLDEAEIALPTGLPVVVVDSSARYTYPVVDTDQAQGARIATEHLLELGHLTVWHISGPRESYSAERWRNAWEAVLRDRGAIVPDVLVGDWGAESGHELGRFLSTRTDATAVFVANDHMALGVMRALHEAGRRVPEGVSVVGFDDVPEAANFWPPLTTVRQHFDRVGESAMRSLIAEIEGESPSGRALVPTTLVVRSSTARPVDVR